jgi:hypothetical protein
MSGHTTCPIGVTLGAQLRCGLDEYPSRCEAFTDSHSAPLHSQPANWQLYSPIVEALHSPVSQQRATTPSCLAACIKEIAPFFYNSSFFLRQPGTLETMCIPPSGNVGLSRLAFDKFGEQ